MKPYYQDSAVTIYHGDCNNIMKDLPKPKLVLTDPPYGINWNTNYSRFTNGMLSYARKDEPKITGDINTNVDSIFGDWELIWWGAYLMPWKIKKVGSWLIWDKRFSNGTAMLSDAELAYWSSGSGAYIYHYTWQGMIKGESGKPEQRLHPTEKPVSLMAWCINKSKADGLIVDPYMGSGPVLRAAKDLNRKAIGIEIEEKYCEIAANRMCQEVLEL